jgi:CRISPR-associated endonuclease Cas1
MAMDAEIKYAISDDEDQAWLERCNHWITADERSGHRRGRRERNAEPLILTGQGVSLRVDNGALLIRDGFTHYPQTQKTYRFFKGDLALPSRILLLDGSGSISIDVLSWLSEQTIPLIRIRWNGEVTCVIGGSSFSADREKVRWQRETRADRRRQMEFSTDLVRRKIENGISTLQTVFSPAPQREAAIRKADQALEVLARATPQDVPSLRSIEAQCASTYFGAWRGLRINWKGTSRRPVPDDWHTFTSRTSLANGRKLKNVNASHPVNAILNYAYTVLQGELQIKAVADGFDPTIGIMHKGRREAPAFVFDLMEPERPNVDRVVLDFVQSTTFHPADFVVTAAGVCRLNPEMARSVADTIRLCAG